jgi:MFS family permease
MHSRTWLIPHDLGPNFRRLLYASGATNLGDGVLLAAGPLYLVSLTSSPAAVGAAVFVQQLPWLLFALLSGAVVDRVDRRRLVVFVDMCRATVMAALALGAFFDNVSVAVVYVVLFILGTGETLADSATSALTVAVVPATRLGHANSRLGVTFTLGNQLVGPPVGALLFSLGSAVPFAVQALMFSTGAVLISRIRVHEPVPEDGARTSLIRDIREGLAWLRHNRPMLVMVLSILIMNVAFTAAFATWVLYCTVLLGLTNLQFGLLVTCSALGGLAGPWVHDRVAPRLGYTGIVRAGFIIEGVVHLVLATAPNPWVVAGTMVVFGVHTMVWGAAAVTVRQQLTPTRLLGRVTSVYFMASIGGSAVGAVIGAVIAQGFGLTAAFWASGVVMLFVAASAWRTLASLQPPTAHE